MPFVPETGAGVEGANAFGSVEDADDYFALRLDPNWTVQERKQGALVLATSYICAEYGANLKSRPATANQGLPFPATGVINPMTGNEYPSDKVPDPILMATFELAKIAAKTGSLYNTAQASDKQVIRDKTGPLETEWQPKKPSELTSPNNYPFVDKLLEPFLSNGGFALTSRRV